MFQTPRRSTVQQSGEVLTIARQCRLACIAGSRVICQGWHGEAPASRYKRAMNSATNATALGHLGDAALGAGRLAEAIAHYQAAVALDSERPNIWYNLGWALRAARQFEAALAAYGEALRHKIDHPEHVHLNRAALLSDHLYQRDAAVAELRLALRLAPGFIPALLNLGTLHEDFGEAQAAQDAYRQALERAPGNGRANARLAMIDIVQGNAGSALDALRAAARHVSAVEDRAELLFATASAQDACGQYDTAFETIMVANRLVQAGRPSPYDSRAVEQFVDRMIATFTRIEHAPAIENASPLRPVFIVGMFRSGSTLFEQILTRHSAIIAGGELEYVPALVHSGLSPYPEIVPQLGASQVGGCQREYLAELARIAPAGWITDKRCDNALHLGLIARLFPHAPIIHTGRHPLDTLISVLFLHFGEAINYGHDQRAAAHYTIQHHRLMVHWRSLFGERIHDIDYDQVVIDPRRAVEPILTTMRQSHPYRKQLAGAQAG
jgi:Flp pilus assembly protein TadD